MDELATLDVDGALAVVTLNAPAQYNAFDEPMLRSLLLLLDRIESDPALRAVMVIGQGAFFSAGGRLDIFASDEEFPERLRSLIDLAHALVRRVAALSIPVVMAVNGVVAGGAIGLVLVGDHVVAAETARLRTAYAALGLVGDAGVTKLLVEAVGARRARNLLMTNRTFTASEAQSWGMIDEVVPSERLSARAREVADALARGPTCAFRSMKALLREACANSYERHLDRERELMLGLAESADALEGIRAFVEKRLPQFVGR